MNIAMTHIRFLRATVLLILSISNLVFAQEKISNGQLNYNKYSFSIPANIEQMISVDLNVDGYQDMLAIHKMGLLVYLQKSDGTFDFSAPSASIDVQGASMGWDIAEFRKPGSTETEPSLLALIDGKTIVTWKFTGNAISEPIPVLEDLSAYLPKGAFRLNFTNDINNDGYIDFVVPGSGQLILRLQNPSGGFQNAIKIQSTASYTTNLESSETIESRIGQGIHIPLMELRDVNSDDLNDLISRTEERLDVFIGIDIDGEQSYPASPSYTLDIAAIQARLGEFSVDKLDLSNLTGMLALTHQEVLVDVDKDGNDDLLIREGGKISLFSGTNDGMDFSQPRQILKSSGNVLAAFIRDENEDELDDLWIIRVESISIGDAFLWLALSGSIEVEAFIYRNEGDQFARRPARKLTLDVKFPSILRLISTASSFEDELENSEAIVRPSVFLNIDRNDYDELIVLLDERIDIFMDAREQKAGEGPSEEEIEAEVELSILTFLDYEPDKDNYEVNIREILDKLVFNRNLNTELVAGREANLQISLSDSAEVGDIFTLELNQDGVDDIVIFLERGDTNITGLLLLSSPME